VETPPRLLPGRRPWQRSAGRTIKWPTLKTLTTQLKPLFATPGERSPVAELSNGDLQRHVEAEQASAMIP
jgi:hypothetical protein